MVLITGKTYDRLKFIAQIFLPALGTFYVTLAGIWGFPAAEAVAGTILAVDTFLGAMLQLSSTAYKNSPERFDGEIEVRGRNSAADVGDFALTLPLNADELEGKDEVVLKVSQPIEGHISPRKRSRG